ncbi:hypothetical protein PAXRUDRAFT_826596 [Paxillus rubicundulus Ve08.2h10]|uniref:Uncharacterized protein n=1 Tax=Paxillus rubicundulus Ve08.2h10 TaxID=930991 RepID=A0A0D0E446_9AGAM|nr:hypothetical protein PAXRUDRAFT_826596 [Paxillus rubicundulus Ve08.2h10]
MPGLPHFSGTNPKSYALRDAVPHGYPHSDVSSPHNMRSGGVSEEASAARHPELGLGVASPGELAIGSYQNTVVGQDLVAAASTSASPGVSKTTSHDCHAQFPCGWPSSDQGVTRVCGKPLSCITASEHFKAHGIINLNKTKKVPCCWHGCRKKMESRRSNFIRHIQESHLGHPRKP